MSVTSYRFELLDSAHGQVVDDSTRQQLLQRPAVSEQGRLQGSASKYVPDPDLRTAINTAIAVGQPLLLTGEPGTGKTQAAYYVGFRLNLRVFHFQARSTSVATDLLYHFDNVRYFHDAHVGKLGGTSGGPPDSRTKMDYVSPREFWDALIESERINLPSILLIDEIDKAPRDFPNDLLHEISEMSFRIAEIPKMEIKARPELRPLVFITSNDERRLPDAFLRRCVSHHIELTEEMLTSVARSHWNEYPALDDQFISKAIERFMELRGRKLEKPPASGELLAWLQVLSLAIGCDPSRLDVDVAKLPYLSTLLKNPDTPQSLIRSAR